MVWVLLGCVALLAVIGVMLKWLVGVSWFWLAISEILFLLMLAVGAWYWAGAVVRQHLIDDVHTLWKRWSTRIAGIQFVGVMAWWGALPTEWKAAVPNWVLTGAVAVSGLLFIAAQAVKQPGLKGDQQ